MITRFLAAAAILATAGAYANTASAEMPAANADITAAFDADVLAELDPMLAESSVFARRGEPEQRGRANEKETHNHNRRGRGHK